ncbi:hypothetical protein PMAYCL1PPCAC_24261 [Pristionchus mayeri]|uniref:Uncharacterized protein n=1 Tax=Pristionchus mayeri TaxID=1317129 RepID=A0AAN5CZK4_9BILA|nr:hypothetical protein PMAYCL1PPCAC_24261 [Pristionchus mayeri]
MTVIRLLATVSIVAFAVTVAAPSTKTGKNAVGSPSKTIKGMIPSSHKVARRGKRSVIVQVPVEMEEERGDDQLEEELSQLSDEQLEMLAEVVQNELERFDPQLPIDQYEIVDIPVEYLTPRGLPRDRRGVPMDEEDDQLVFVPQEVLEEALMEEALEEAAEEELAKELDDIELRARIGEMANILNERASRGYRRR